MFPTSISSRQGLLFVVPVVVFFLLTACSKKAEPPASAKTAKEQVAPASPVSSPEEPPAPSIGITFGPVFARRTGDLNEMAKSRNIRALVLLNPIGFFYDKGLPRGVMLRGAGRVPEVRQPEAEDRQTGCESHIHSYASRPD